MNLARITDVSEHRAEAAAPAGAPHNQRMEVVHALMRGRYRWATLLAILFAVPAGWAGYKLGKPIYQSDVPIRVEPTERRVLYDDEEKAALPRYESFVETQMALIKSQRVVELAMADPQWTQLRRPDGLDAELQFLNNLDVTRKDELITIAFSDTDPQAAVAGAEAVAKAYRNLYAEADQKYQEHRSAILTRIVNEFNNDLLTETKNLASTTDKYKVHEVRKLADGKYEELHLLEMKLADLELRLDFVAPATQPSHPAAASLDSLVPATQPSEPVVTGGDRAAWTPEDFASTDMVMAKALQRQTELQEQLDIEREQGLLDGNRSVHLTEAQLHETQNAIQNRLEKLQQMPQRSLLPDNRFGDTALISTPAELSREIATVRGKIAKAEADFQELDKASADTDDLRSQIDETKKNLEAARGRIDHLSVEQELGGRITFPTDEDGRAVGERPLAPFKDTRRKFAAAGALGAGMLGFGLILAITLLDRRVRNADEVRVRLSIGQLLGVLPALPDDLSEPEQAAAAAHAVHQIRSMLQIRITNPKPCFAVTSPQSGTGKTSLSLALAFSFASAGAKTLIVDCDLVGGGLTRKLNATARRRIGCLLRGKGLIDTTQLRNALNAATVQKKQVGQVLIEMGLATAHDIDECLIAQAKMSFGLIDAINGEPLVNCISPTGVDNCYVLPVGGATAHHAVSLSPSRVKRIIEAARETFDVVIIDSGPIPGSLEASAVAVAVDGVVMLVSRGEPRAVVEQCLSRLRRVGAPLAGVVLNRVDNAEMLAYSGSVSVNSRTGTSSGVPGLLPKDVNLSGDVGPIATAVICSSPAARID